MNRPDQEADDLSLSRVLRSARPEPALPPRFEEGVWRRIERAEPGRTDNRFRWLEVVANSLLRPKFALATVAALVLLGAALGVREGFQTARLEAEARYVATVAPRVLQ